MTLCSRFNGADKTATSTTSMLISSAAAIIQHLKLQIFSVIFSLFSFILIWWLYGGFSSEPHVEPFLFVFKNRRMLTGYTSLICKGMLVNAWIWNQIWWVWTNTADQELCERRKNDNCSDFTSASWFHLVWIPVRVSHGGCSDIVICTASYLMTASGWCMDINIHPERTTHADSFP